MIWDLTEETQFNISPRYPHNITKTHRLSRRSRRSWGASFSRDPCKSLDTLKTKTIWNSCWWINIKIHTAAAPTTFPGGPGGPDCPSSPLRPGGPILPGFPCGPVGPNGPGRPGSPWNYATVSFRAAAHHNSQRWWKIWSEPLNLVARPVQRGLLAQHPCLPAIHSLAWLQRSWVKLMQRVRQVTKAYLVSFGPRWSLCPLHETDNCWLRHGLKINVKNKKKPQELEITVKCLRWNDWGL